MFNWLYKRVAKFVQPNDVLVAEIVAKNIDKLDTETITNNLAKNTYFAAEVGQVIAYNIDTATVAENIDINRVVNEININNLASYFDAFEIAQHIQIDAKDIASHIDFTHVAQYIQLQEHDYNQIAANIDYKKLAISLIEAAKESK